MSTPLLKTKLYIPPTRPELVSRPRLIERLDTGLHRKLTLVSAQAGFGKTTLVSEWVASLRRGGQRVERGDTDASSAPLQVAWLSLDESDNDLVRFLSYLTAALRAGLQTVETQRARATQWEPAGVIGKEALAMLQSPQSPPIEVVLTSLINDIASLAQIACTTIVLILDDYHLIEGDAGASQAIHEALTFLLQHLPPQMHLVVVSRSDPFFLPLSRLRARGQMIDIRADDLRFSPQEAATFLNQMMGLALSGDQVATLETRTEGWITGLQLAALSMQGQEDAAGLISAFAADDRYIADYLVDEVLARRPKGTKDFMLQTSVLDRLTGPL